MIGGRLPARPARRFFYQPNLLRDNVTRYDVTADGKKFLINAELRTAGADAVTPIAVVLNWPALLKK